jgi:hypothetical protein
MNTDGHRSSDALPSCPRLGVGETLWLGILSVAPKVELSVFICVHLWLKAFPAARHEEPSISLTKIRENPSKTPHRQASSTLNFFGGNQRVGISVQVSATQIHMHCIDRHFSFLLAFLIISASLRLCGCDICHSQIRIEFSPSNPYHSAMQRLPVVPPASRPRPGTESFTA